MRTIVAFTTLTFALSLDGLVNFGSAIGLLGLSSSYKRLAHIFELVMRVVRFLFLSSGAIVLYVRGCLLEFAKLHPAPRKKSVGEEKFRILPCFPKAV